MWLSKRRNPTPCQIQVPEGGQGPHGLGYTRGEGSPPSSGGGTPHMNREHLSSQSPAYSWVLVLMFVLLLESLWCIMPLNTGGQNAPKRVVRHAPTQFASMPSSKWPSMPSIKWPSMPPHRFPTFNPGCVPAYPHTGDMPSRKWPSMPPQR